MDVDAITVDLRILAPEECVWWGVETDYDGAWKRRTLAPGRQGPRERFWHVDRLSLETVRSLFGPGRHRFLWFKQNRRGRCGTSRPIDIGEEAPPDTKPSEQSETIGQADTVPPPCQVPDELAELESPEPALARLDPERLAAVLQGRPADTDPTGRAIAVLERLNQLYLSMNQVQFAQMKHEAALQVARAKAEVELVKAQERERSAREIEQARIFYQMTTEHTEKVQQIEADARTRERSQDLEDLRSQMRELLEAFSAQQESQGTPLSDEQEDILAHLIRAAGPDLLKQVAAKFLNGGPQGAIGIARAAAQDDAAAMDELVGGES